MQETFDLFCLLARQEQKEQEHEQKEQEQKEQEEQEQKEQEQEEQEQEQEISANLTLAMPTQGYLGGGLVWVEQAMC